MAVSTEPDLRYCVTGMAVQNRPEYSTAIDHVYFYEIDFAKLIIRYLSESLESPSGLEQSL